jgi:hypothetical protein
MKLTKTEAQSPVWHLIKEHLESRLDSFRKQNDFEDLTEKQTALMRGRIKELKYLIDLDTSPSHLTDADE